MKQSTSGARPPLRVALAQINPVTGDLRANARLIVEAIQEGRRQGAHLVVLPELCLTGYCLDEKLLMGTSFLRANRRLLDEEVAPATRGIAAVVGFLDFDPSRKGPDGVWVRYNAAAVLQDGGLAAVVRKRLLPSYRYFEEKRYFEAGQGCAPITLKTPHGSARIGVLVCEDMWDEGYSQKPAQCYSRAGVDCLVSINASPFVSDRPGRRDGKGVRRLRLARRQVRDTGLPVIYVNTAGTGDNGKNVIVFDGGSFALDESGRCLGRLAAFAPEIRTVEIFSGAAPVEAAPEMSREEGIFRALTLGVRDYFDKSESFDRVLEPISGGIDSALGAVIAHRAVGPERLSLYNLPTRFNSPATRANAGRLADNLGLSCRVVPIEDLSQQISAVFSEHLHPVERSVTLENVQARLRGLLMMMESNDRRGLLLTNANATEIALGYSTLYGDMAGGLAVIGDLTKPDVYRVARWVNRDAGADLIPAGILEATPSAELREGQSDPFDYEIVGPMVSDMIEFGWGPLEFQERFRRRALDPLRYPDRMYHGHDRGSFLELARGVARLLRRAVYKRLQGAPIIAVTERAFGFDLRETLINGWDEEKMAARPAQPAGGSGRRGV